MSNQLQIFENKEFGEIRALEQEYIDAAIHELKAVEEKFRAMLREKKKERRERSD